MAYARSVGRVAKKIWQTQFPRAREIEGSFCGRALGRLSDKPQRRDGAVVGSQPQVFAARTGRGARQGPGNQQTTPPSAGAGPRNSDGMLRVGHRTQVVVVDQAGRIVPGQRGKVERLIRLQAGRVCWGRKLKSWFRSAFEPGHPGTYGFLDRAAGADHGRQSQLHGRRKTGRIQWSSPQPDRDEDGTRFPAPSRHHGRKREKRKSEKLNGAAWKTHMQSLRRSMNKS